MRSSGGSCDEKKASALYTIVLRCTTSTVDKVGAFSGGYPFISYSCMKNMSMLGSKVQVWFVAAHRSEVREMWGGEDIFEDFVRTELPSIVLEGKLRYHCCCLA